MLIPVIFKSLNYQILIAILAGNFLALTGDSSTTWPSPVLPKLYSNDSDINPLGKPITEDEESWIGSLNSMGAMIGLYPLGLLADLIGRKFTLLMLAVPHFVAFIIYAFAQNIYLFYVGRFLNGLAVSVGYVVLPMYVAEISPDSSRGLMLMSYTIFSSMGNLISYSTGPYLSIFWFDILLAVFPVIFFVMFAIIAPESPYYYVIKNNRETAKETLRLLRPVDYKFLDKEIKEIQEEVEKARQGNILSTLRTKLAVKGSVIAIALSTLQQLSGYAAFMSFTQLIFMDAGTNIPSDISSIIIGIVFFFASLCGSFLVDRMGRIILLIFSLCGMIIAEIILGTYYVLKDHNVDVSSITWIPVVCLIAFMFSYNIGIGPLPIMITSEILPVNVKFIVATTAAFFSWMGTFIVTKFFNDLNNALGRGGTVWLFSGGCVIALLLTIFIVPETKGKSFLEIQTIMEK